MAQINVKLQPQYVKLQSQLQQALSELKLQLSDEQQLQLLYYLQQLLFWNKAYNLTAIKDDQQALIKHIFDSLSIVPFLPAGDLLDIGTGAGLHLTLRRRMMRRSDPRVLVALTLRHR